jgi:hypothetical protein
VVVVVVGDVVVSVDVVVVGLLVDGAAVVVDGAVAPIVHGKKKQTTDKKIKYEGP